MDELNFTIYAEGLSAEDLETLDKTLQLICDMNPNTHYMGYSVPPALVEPWGLEGLEKGDNHGED